MKSYRCIPSVKLRAWKGLQKFFPLNWEFGKKNGLPVLGCGWKSIILEKSKLILCGDRGLNSHIKLGKRISSQEIIVKTGWEIHGSDTGRHKIASWIITHVQKQFNLKIEPKSKIWNSQGNGPPWEPGVSTNRGIHMLKPVENKTMWKQFCFKCSKT